MPNGKGRPPKPTALKLLHGTDRKDRQVANEVQFDQLGTDTDPSFPLNDFGMAEWRRILPQVTANGLLTRAGQTALTAYCNEIGTYIEYDQLAKASGRIHVRKKEDGTIDSIIQNPYTKIADTALKNALKLAAEFGFTPAAATKVPSNKKKDENPLAKLLNKQA